MEETTETARQSLPRTTYSKELIELTKMRYRSMAEEAFAAMIQGLTIDGFATMADVEAFIELARVCFEAS